MITVYIVLGLFALILIYIVIKYSINSHKINKKKKPASPKVEHIEEKKDVKKSDDSKQKDESKEKTVFLDESPKELAMRKAFEESKQKELEIPVVIPTNVEHGYDNDANLTELERALADSGKKTRFGLETSKIEHKHMRSETNVIGREGPIKNNQDSNNSQTDGDDREIDVSNMSDDMKKILIADIIKRKYWFIIKTSQA